MSSTASSSSCYLKFVKIEMNRFDFIYMYVNILYQDNDIILFVYFDLIKLSCNNTDLQSYF